MRKRRLLLAPILLSLLPGHAMANQQEFCTGFLEGFKSMMGSMGITPLCPLEPITPIGSSSFAEGYKVAIAVVGAHYPDRNTTSKANDPRDLYAKSGDRRTATGQAAPGSGFGTQFHAIGRPPDP